MYSFFILPLRATCTTHFLLLDLINSMSSGSTIASVLLYIVKDYRLIKSRRCKYSPCNDKATSRPALRPIQPPNQWVLGAL